jgi:hypothetical protein
VRRRPNPSVSSNGAGKTIIAWRGFDGEHFRVQVAVRLAGAAFSPPRFVSLSGRHAGAARTAVDSAGNAVVVWQRHDGRQRRVQARLLHADGQLGPVQTLSPAGVNARAPRVAVDNGGNAIAVWHQARRGSRPEQVGAAVARAGRRFGPAKLVSGTDRARGARVVADGEGEAVVTWVNDSGRDACWVRAATYTRTVGFKPPRTVSDPFADCSSAPGLAVNDDGVGAVTWQSWKGKRGHVNQLLPFRSDLRTAT